MAKFNIHAFLHRYEGRNKYRSQIWKRHYATLENAAKRAVEFLMQEGRVGDVIEFVVIKTGEQRGISHYRLSGQIETIWNNDDKAIARSGRLLAKRKQDFALAKFLKALELPARQ